MPPGVRAESRAKQGELAITGYDKGHEKGGESVANTSFLCRANKSRFGKILHGMQGVSGSNPLGSIKRSQARPGFFNVWRSLGRGSDAPRYNHLPLFGSRFGA